MQDHKDVLKDGQKPLPMKGADTDDTSAKGWRPPKEPQGKKEPFNAPRRRHTGENDCGNDPA